MSGEEKWEVFVVGMEAGIQAIKCGDTKTELEACTISKFRKLVKEKWPHVQTDADDLRLLFAGKPIKTHLSSGEEATLKDYYIQRGSTIQLVFRMPGGQDDQPNFTIRVKPPEVVLKIHDVNDAALKFTTKLPDSLDPLSDDPQPRIVLSCGHAVGANTLTAWCRSLIEEQKFEFHCPAFTDSLMKNQCKNVWEYEEVRRVAHLNAAEQQYFESKMSEHAVLQYCDMKECPGCRSFVEREDMGNLRVHCMICTKNKKKNFDFCWNCNKEWSGPVTSSLKCGNPDCAHPSLSSIQNAEMVKLPEVNDVEVPNRRACPTCGNVVEHNLQGCKFMICPRCKKEFCFACLELKNTCLAAAESSWYNKCSKPVAPKQASIPVWSQSE